MTPLGLGPRWCGRSAWLQRQHRDEWVGRCGGTTRSPEGGRGLMESVSLEPGVHAPCSERPPPAPTLRDK